MSRQLEWFSAGQVASLQARCWPGAMAHWPLNGVWATFVPFSPHLSDDTLSLYVRDLDTLAKNTQCNFATYTPAQLAAHLQSPSSLSRGRDRRSCPAEPAAPMIPPAVSQNRFLMSVSKRGRRILQLIRQRKCKVIIWSDKQVGDNTAQCLEKQERNHYS